MIRTSCMKMMLLKADFKLHFRCFFSGSQVGNIYLLQGEFAESICFLFQDQALAPILFMSTTWE